MNKSIRGKPLPPRFHNRFTFDWHRRFTLKERLQIAIGYQFKVTTEIYTVNSPGILQPVFIGQTTKHINPTDQATADCAKAIAELKANAAP